MGKNMSILQPSSLSNSELLLACDNAWNEDAGLPLAMQFELYSRFRRMNPANVQPVKDARQLELAL